MEVSKRIAQLPPEKRLLLEHRLQERLAATQDPLPLHREHTDVYPLSFAQEQLWFLHQLEPNVPLYNSPRAFRLRGKLNQAVLRESIREIVQRHEILHTTFVTIEDQPMQVVAPSVSLPLTFHDFTAFPDDQREALAKHYLEAESRKPFNLGQSPPFRVSLLQLAEEEHILLIIFHHLVFDGWSSGIFFTELQTIYTARMHGMPINLPELPIQYGDFALWQRKFLHGSTLEHLLKYWRKQVPETFSPLELPTDFPRPTTPNLQGGRISLLLPTPLLRELYHLAQQEQVTLFTLLLAAFQVLIARYSKQEQIMIGSNIANRSRPEFEKLIGFFTNTVVFKSDLTGNPSFLVLLQRVQQIVVGALAHQELPFEFLVKDVQPKRTVSQISPLLQILFVMQPGQSVPLSLGDARGEALTVDTGMASFDLVLSAEERHDGLALEVQYRSDLFLEQTISRFLGHFRTLLEGAIANPHLPVAELPLLTQQEYQQIVFDWNTSHQSIADEGSVVALFECQVAQTPDAIALITCDGEQLTFGELNSRANQIANVMCQLGVGPEVNVGVCAGRSPLLVMALLAVLKAGGAYVPLDPIYPSQRLAFALENSEIKVLLTQQHLMSLFSHGSLPIVLLDADGGQFDQQPVSRPERSMLPQTLAYTIYTSGSTGQPKGVQVSNYSLTNFVSVITHLYNLHAGHRQLQFVSMGFDVFVEEIFPPLCCGASILLGLDPKTSTPSEIMDMIDRLGVTKINMTASYWHQLVDELLAQDKQVPTTLQILTVGAESPSAAKLHAWRGLVKHPLRMFNVYGPTETTVIASTYCIPDESNPSRIPIGKPVANTQLYLLDDHLQPVPVGIAGELYIGGDALARGYAMLPDVTAERFIPHPWDPRPGKRIYRTGDLARFLPDGNIEFLGRVDYQVKVRGFRIELEEIEAIVHKHPRVKECVVIALPDASNHLACYLVPTGQAPLPGELRQFLSTHLPDYMIPAHFIILPALPLSPNGKLDRQALPPPTADDQKADVVYIAPRTPVEQTLARIWAGVLGLERVGIHDNFFDAGGDSILSLQIVARARQEKLYLTPRHIFEYQTIAQLAPVARTIEPVVATGDVRSLEPELVPLSPIQCWFFEQELPNPHHWNQAMLLEVHLLLDKPGLETIFRYLLAQHRVFRLRFQRKERLWQQIMTGSEEEHSISLAWIDLSMLENLAEQKKAIESFAATMQTGLNITEGPLVSVALFHLGGQQADRLLIIIHHLIIDIVSWNILLEDLQTLCLQMTRGETLYLPPEITSFPMWASYLSSYAQSPVVREERLYWQQITRPPFVPLPVDHEQGANTTASVQVVQGSLSASETLALLHDVPSLSHTQVREALLTALAQTLIPWIGQPYLLVHLEGHGREEIFPEIDLSRTLGWFTSMFPVRLELPAETTDVGSALQTIKELLRQVPNKGLGYGVLRYLCPDDDVAMPLRTQPQAQVSFHYSGHQPSSRSSLFTNANEAFGPVQSSEGFRQHLFDILVQIDGNGQLQLSWFYSEAIYLRSSIEMLVHTYLAALRTLIAHCLVAGGHSYAPSDFPLAKLNRQQLGNILKRIGRPKEKKDV